MFLKDIFKN